METATDINAKLIGINNRNLKDFSVDINTTELLAKLAPESSILVSESGIFTYDDVLRVKSAGAGAVLVGESLMRQENIPAAVRKLLGISCQCL